MGKLLPNMCDGKVKHMTRFEARRAALIVAKKKGLRNTVSAYYCQLCDHYHWGNNTPKPRTFAREQETRK